MKSLKFIAAVMMLCFTLGATAQVKRVDSDVQKKKDSKGAVITDRQKAFFQEKEPSEADLQWMKVIYRSVDLTKGKNPALYYPEEPNADGENLFYIIMRLLTNDEISAYEYLDGREMFTDEYKIKVSEMLDRFHILYDEAKGSTEKHPKYVIDNSDIPSNEVLSYFIIERWEFDTRSNQMKSRVEALCPVMHRTDEFGGEPIRYPMFWVKLNDIRPYMAQQYVFTDDDNNLARYSLDDFFKLNMYTGDIYKVKNLRNQSLAQQFPDEEAYKHAQDSIEERLHRFNKNLWVPSREELQAMADSAKAKEGGEEALAQEGDDDGGETVGQGDDDTQEEVKSVRTTKRGRSKSGDTKTTQKSNKKRTKVKERKSKQRTTKSSNSAVKSVRNRKR